MAVSRKVKLSDRQCKIVHQRIKAARSYRDEVLRNPYEDSSTFATINDRNLALVAGTYWEKQQRYGMRTENHIGPAVQVQQDVITDGNTQFLLQPTKPRFANLIDVAQATINHCWRRLDFDAPCNDARWDVPIHGFGAVEIGWRYEDDEQEITGDRPQEPPVSDDAQPLMAPDGKTMLPPNEGPIEYGSDEEAQAASDIADDVEWGQPKVDDPYIERFDPRTLIIDPQATKADLSDARYAFREKTEFLDKLKRNKRYSYRNEITSTRLVYTGKGNSEHSVNTGAEVPKEAKEDCSLVLIWDGYCKLQADRDGQEELLHIVWAEGMDKPLLCESIRVVFEGSNPFPYEFLMNWKADNDTWLPVRDVDQTYWLQRMHDESMSQFDAKRRTTVDKLLIPEELSNNTDTVDALMSSIPNESVPMPIAHINMLKWLEHPPVNAEGVEELKETPDKIRRVLGISDYQLNTKPDRKMLATEVVQQREQGGTRQNADIDAFQKFKCRCAYKVMTLLQEFGVRGLDYAVDNNGEQQWGKATLEQLRGVAPAPFGLDSDLEKSGIQFIFEIDADSKSSRSLMMERQEAVELAGMMAKFANIDDPYRPGKKLVDLRPLLQRVLRTWQIPNINEIVAPEPTPEDKEAKYLQLIQQATEKINLLSQQNMALKAKVQSGQPAQEVDGPQAAARLKAAIAQQMVDGQQPQQETM